VRFASESQGSNPHPLRFGDSEPVDFVRNPKANNPRNEVTWDNSPYASNFAVLVFSQGSLKTANLIIFAFLAD